MNNQEHQVRKPKRVSDPTPRELPSKVDRNTHDWTPNTKVRRSFSEVFVTKAPALVGLSVLGGIVALVYVIMSKYS